MGGCWLRIGLRENRGLIALDRLALPFIDLRCIRLCRSVLDTRLLMPYQYGQMFERLGVPGMGRQGSGWCALDPDGVMVLMSHQAFYRKRDGTHYYDAPGDPRLPTIAASAARSIRMLAEYFQPGREILLPIGVFLFDGRIGPDGSHEPSRFSYATGDVYRAQMLEFDPQTGRLLCETKEMIRGMTRNGQVRP